MKVSPDRSAIDVPDGHTLGATLDGDGKPIYFAVPDVAADAEVAGMAFEARHGRPPSEAEWTLLAMLHRTGRT